MGLVLASYIAVIKVKFIDAREDYTAGLDLSIKQYRESALFYAISTGHILMLEQLLEKGVDPNSVNEDGYPPLAFVAANNQLEMAKLLLKNGGKANDINAKNWTPILFYAVKKGNSAMARLLIEAGADVNLTDRRGASALTEAADRDCGECVKLLLANHANLENRGRLNRTAIIFAVEQDNFEMTQLLIDAGADLNVIDEHGWTPYSMAANAYDVEKKPEHAKLMDTLVKAGADPKLRDFRDSRSYTSFLLHMLNGDFHRMGRQEKRAKPARNRKIAAPNTK